MKLPWQKNDEKLYWRLLILVFMAVFMKFLEPGLGNSSTGYGALARNLSQDNQWFHLKVSTDFFNPFADHPPLVIWINAIIFKILGASSQTIRLLSSFAALGIFSALFFTVRRYFDERIAMFSVLLLLLVNVFMNYTSSGWLDMSMIGFVWGGTYLLFRGHKEGSSPLMYLGGFLFGLSVLAKGVCALGLFPPVIFIFYKLFKQKRFLTTANICGFTLLPVIVFTIAHYRAEGYLFWFRYLMREAVEQTLNNPDPTFLDRLWYLQRILQYGHVVTLAGILGVWNLWQNNKKDWALLIMGQVLIHALGYSWSTRHYSQYVTPVFPWISLAAAYWMSTQLKKIKTEDVSKWSLRVMVAVFVTVDILPIRVHSGNENPWRSFTKNLERMKDNKRMYFVGDMKDQSTWEDPCQYIVWYWGRDPKITNLEMLFDTINSRDPEALGIVDTELYQKNKDRLRTYANVTVCMWNDKLTLVSQKSLCPDEIKTWRYREPAKTQWAHAP